MEEKKLVPKRRFSGFDNGWVERNLKDLRDESEAYSYTGGPFGSDLKATDYTKTGVRIIQLQNIGDGFFANKYKIYTSKEKAEALSSNLIYPDDIIIAKMADPLARAAIIPDDEDRYLMASDGIRLKVDKSKFDNYFILTLINHDNFRTKALENSTGTTRKRIGLVTLGKLKSFVPEISEQQKIGEFFKVLDKRIANQERKIAKVKALKTAYLNEMFPKEEEMFPKKRFGNFQKPWKKYKLGDIVTFLKGKGLARKDMIENGKYECILYGHLYTVYGMLIDDIIFKTNTIPQNKLTSQKGDILIPSSDTTPTGLARAASLEKDDILLGGDINVLRPNENINGSFLSYNINANRSQLLKLIKGTTVKHIYNDDLKDVIVRVPDRKEQAFVVEFFKNLDDQISTEEKKLEKLKKMKEAYLEEMFV